MLKKYIICSTCLRTGHATVLQGYKEVTQVTRVTNSTHARYNKLNALMPMYVSSVIHTCVRHTLSSVMYFTRTLKLKVKVIRSDRGKHFFTTTVRYYTAVLHDVY